MSEESHLKDHTRMVFKETVDIYRHDLNAILKNPGPFLIALAALLLFALLIAWL